MAYFIDGVQYTKEEYDIKLKEVQAHVALINGYVQKIVEGIITLNDVPAEYFDEVYSIINPPEPEEPEDVEATEADYQEALAEMGVKLDEED